MNEISTSKEEILQDLLKRCLNNKKRIKSLEKEINILKYPKEKIEAANNCFDKSKQLIKEQKYEEASDYLNKAIEYYPNDARFYIYRSINFYYLSQFNEALEAAEKAISINSKDIYGYYYKGKALEALRRNKEALDTYKLGLEKDENNDLNELLNNGIKELELNTNFKISNIKNFEEIEKDIGSIHSLLLLKDGRISIGHTAKKGYDEVIREAGIEIYGQTIYNKIMFIKGLGPYQTELKDGNLLIGSDNVLSIVKLNKKTYDVLQNIKTGKIKNTIELYNGFLANFNPYYIYFYKKDGDEYSRFDTREPSINTKCGLIIEGKTNELVIYLYNDSDKKEN